MFTTQVLQLSPAEEKLSPWSLMWQENRYLLANFEGIRYLRAPVCNNQTNSNFPRKRGEIQFLSYFNVTYRLLARV